MKKICSILLILILTMSLCLVSCDDAKDGEGGATTAGSADATDTPATNGTDGTNATDGTENSDENGSDAVENVTENVVVTDDEGNAVTDGEGNVVTEVVDIPATNAPENAPSSNPDAEITDAPSEGEDEDTPDATVSTNAAPEVGEDPSVDVEIELPSEKTPLACYKAAILTMETLSNGTLRYGMLQESDHSNYSRVAVLKIADGNYYVQDGADELPVLFVDGYAYDTESKRAIEMNDESFRDEFFPYDPLTNALIPFSDEMLAGLEFETVDGDLVFHLTLTAEEYAALIGAENSSSLMTEMSTTATFASNGLLKSLVFAATFEQVDLKEDTRYSATSTLSVELSDLGTTAPITAPADADDYEITNNDSFDSVVTVPSGPTTDNKEPSEEDKPVEDKPVEDKPVEDKPVEDKQDNPEEDKNSANDKEHSAFPEGGNRDHADDYEREIEENLDLNGDGFIGDPANDRVPHTVDRPTEEKLPTEPEQEKE